MSDLEYSINIPLFLYPIPYTIILLNIKCMKIFTDIYATAFQLIIYIMK